MELVSGFSKLTKDQKTLWLAKQLQSQSSDVQAEGVDTLSAFQLSDEKLQKIFDEFSENTVSNFILPFGIAPNFIINQKIYSIPMVVEESSVVAAASHAAKFWSSRGGFHTEILGTEKVGQVHFIFSGNKELLFNFFQLFHGNLLDALKPYAKSMEKRGGGILKLELLEASNSQIQDYFQLQLTVNTCDAMGANFINTLLEALAQNFKEQFKNYIQTLNKNSDVKHFEIVMSILSNFTPGSTVRVWVSCKAEELGSIDGLTSMEFIRKFITATEIARNDISRAVTHNKGIMNGIDAVVLATGNDFRAVEACAHAYASRDGKYRSLSFASFNEDGEFRFEMEIPLAVGTVGGLTKLHPLSRFALQLLGNPKADELMQIIAAVGLAQNFSALRSLITTGIQKGHMKMHLLNVLHQLNASEIQVEAAKRYFQDKVISYTDVKNFLSQSCREGETHV
jgi:hydroxymethylglutaryl-CoA reductase